MATHAYDFGRAPVLPLRRALALIPSLPRPLLKRFVEQAIDRLDLEDGDPDLENATNAEDEGITWASAISVSWNGAGCPVGDPGGGNVTDEPHDQENDAEVETWAHPDDHPAELFIGKRR